MKDEDLAEMAADELERALTLRWRDLAKAIPWGDVYDGFAPGGRPVQVERNYLWAREVGGDILCEVAVFTNPVLYDHGARASGLIPRQA
jgi:hypothetical protein